jgi:transcriptional regulator with XRE-family HTH domain
MHVEGSLKARQIRAARALLDWSQDDLANASGLSIATIRKMELGHISPRGKTTSSFRRTFEDAGLEFIEPDGVRHRPDEITVYQGSDGLHAFFDDVYATAKRRGGEILHVCASEDPYEEILGDYHSSRMTEIRDKVTVKCILTENPDNIFCSPYCEYRFISKHYVDSVPFYVYDNKYAAIIFGADPSPKVIVVQSPVMSRAFRCQFESMWDKATQLNKRGDEPPKVKKHNRNK